MSEIATETPKADDCMSCTVVETFVETLVEFSEQVATALQPGTEILFGAMVILLFSWKGWQMTQGLAGPQELIKPLFALFIASILVSVEGITYTKTFFEASMSIMGGLGSLGLDPTSKTVAAGAASGGGLNELIRTLSNLIQNMTLEVFEAIAKASWWKRVSLFFFAFIFLLGFIAQLIMFTCYIIVTAFSLMLMGAVSPLLAMSMCWGWGIQAVFSAFKIILNNILTLFFCSLSVGLSVTVVTKVLEIDDKSKALESGTMLVMGMVVGWAGLLLMFQGARISDALTQISAGTSSAASMGAAPILKAYGQSVKAGAKMGGQVAAGAGAMAAKGAYQVGKAAYSKLKGRPKNPQNS